jgi:hypothetical protein
VTHLNLGSPPRPRRRRADGEVTRLIDRIRELVADQRRLDGDSESERREINRREIARLRDRLAIAVRRELGRE